MGVKSRGQEPEELWGPYLSSFLSRFSWLTHVAFGTLKVEDEGKDKLRHGNSVISWERQYSKSCWSLARLEHLVMGSVSPEGPGGPHQALMTLFSEP